MSYLNLNNISKTYKDSIAVDDINLNIKKGEFISLLGPSGCGKTTTLRMIAGFISPTAGEIVLENQVLSSEKGVVLPEKRGMSMIFQSYAIWPNMTVFENVAFGLNLRDKKNKQEIRKSVYEMLEIVQLEHLADRYPAELSGGQQQRVALARAVIIKPKVLLLDEPLSNLDANLREEMRIQIHKLHKEFEMTTVYVTHDQSEAMSTADRIAVMNAGRIEQIDAPLTIYNQPKSMFVAKFIGRTNLLSGRPVSQDLDFGGFSIPQDMLGVSGSITDDVNVSIRPQFIDINKNRINDGSTLEFPAKVEYATYLGEHWDYRVRIDNSDLSIAITTRPDRIFELGDSVWINLDAGKISVID